MMRSALENKYYRDQTPESSVDYEKQETYTKRQERKKEVFCKLKFE